MANMINTLSWMTIVSACVWAQPAPTEPDDARTINQPLSNVVRVLIRSDRTTIPVGNPVYIEFVAQNLTGDNVTLTVPGALKSKVPYEFGMGLPLEHVFSSAEFRGLELASERNPQMGHRVIRKPQYPVPSITLAPYASVGLRFDVARFYPGLHQSGTYTLQWKPYGGAVKTKPLTIEVVSFKQAIIETEYGSMTMRLLYGKAPRHVQNFQELAQKRFYNGTTFHTLYQNQFILGGDPAGDGTGKRPDGVCLDPEFNDTPFELGTVGMALIESDTHSASCQFFICLSRQAGWDGRYTAFGRIQGPESLATLRKIGQITVDDDRHPREPLKIKSISIVDAPFISRDLD
ncbi:MAG: peptidylprolyl isomerase [Phycisphaerae bacterium]